MPVARPNTRGAGPARGAGPHARPSHPHAKDRAPRDTDRPDSRPLSGATISFGLVTIPVELRTATRSLAPAFHLVHQVCGNRIHQQLYCPVCQRVVERNELVRGFDVGKDRYVVFTPEELEHLEGEASRTIDIAEFVPLSAVDPIYYETTYYLSPGRDGGKAYGVLAEAMAGDARIALATFVMRGKENLVAIRADNGVLLLHTLFFADEVRPRPTISRETRPSRPEEIMLARRLIDALTSDTFAPERYVDAYRRRVLDAARAKSKGETIEVEPVRSAPAPVVNIMDALKASLERRKPPTRTSGTATTSRTRPARRAS
jgi:DNA end-binding protein Ku